MEKKRLLTRKEFLIGSGTILASALVACTARTTMQTSVTSTPTGKTLTSTIPADSTAQTETTTLTPKNGGIFKYGTNPTAASIGWPVDVMGQGGGLQQPCMETLLRSDSKGNVYPWLAESYQVADDLKSINFKLKRGVKFHDGSDFNANVAAWSLEQYIASGSENLWASVDIIDDYTIRVNFVKWNNTLLESFADSSFEVYMLSRTGFEKNGRQWMELNPIGTGPFKFDSFTNDVGIKYVRNSDYWIKDRPYLEGIDYTFVNDPMTMMMALKTGEIDCANNIDLKDISGFVASGFIPNVYCAGNFYLVPDTANADSPWANLNFCEAVEYAIDREGIAKAFGYGYWQAPYQIPPSSTIVYDPNFTMGRKYDLERAKQLLVAAGYANGIKTSIVYNSTFANVDILAAIQGSLANVGIEVSLDAVDIGKYVTYLGPGTWPKNSAMLMGFPGQNTYFTRGLQFLFDQIGQSWLRTPEMTQAYQTALTSSQPDVKLVRAVTDMMTKNALLIPIYVDTQSKVKAPYVMTDFNTRGYLYYWDTEGAWLNK